MSRIFNDEGKVTPVTLLKPREALAEDQVVSLLGQAVVVRGKSKGKGFTGVMKRWGFSGHPATHGHFAVRRHPGSIGAQGEGRVMPSKKMAGRGGGKKIYIEGLKIVKIDNGLLYLSGPVPGHKGGVVELTVVDVVTQQKNS